LYRGLQGLDEFEVADLCSATLRRFIEYCTNAGRKVLNMTDDRVAEASTLGSGRQSWKCVDQK
jgi:hypothetical protein